ncbi:MAG: hypothetical protein K6T83_05220 [Alicyclobacillus sp.]|nr:hypothetical protein [Alicyclobacillus sp.]
MVAAVEFVRVLLRNKRSLIGMVILIFFFLMATVGPRLFKT